MKDQRKKIFVDSQIYLEMEKDGLLPDAIQFAQYDENIEKWIILVDFDDAIEMAHYLLTKIPIEEVEIPSLL